MRFIITAGPGDTKAETDRRSDRTGLRRGAVLRLHEVQRGHAQGRRAVASEGLNPGAKGARVGVAGGKRTVLDGPFTETKELVGGFYIVDVASLDEAISWALRCPVGLGTDNLLEIRPLTEMTDIPPTLLELSAKVAPAWTASVTDGRSRRKAGSGAFTVPALAPSGGSSGCRPRCARTGRGRPTRRRLLAREDGEAADRTGRIVGFSADHVGVRGPHLEGDHHGPTFAAQAPLAVPSPMFRCSVTT